jgi:hypothetical protein
MVNKIVLEIIGDMVELKSYPAKNGDAFLLKASNNPFAMLIDGGFVETFQKYIRSDLENLAANDYALDLVVATHIDADHITGLISFFVTNGTAKEPKIIPVREVLFNSLRSLVSRTLKQPVIRPDDLALLREIRLRGYPFLDAVNDLDREISARQGNSLAQLLHDGNYQWNTHTGTIPIGGDGFIEHRLPQASIKVLGPNEERLTALTKWWVSEIRRLGLVGPLDELDDVFEFLCAHEMVNAGEQLLASSDADLAEVYFPDSSVTNGSSISLIVEVEGRRLLFLGDSWADDIVTALGPRGPTIFDAVKLSHHGSVRNTNPELLALVDSPHFFISTNGAHHDHPSYAVLKAIVDRPAEFCRVLHFNYSTPASRRLKEYQNKTGANFMVDEDQTDWVGINGLNAI